MRASSEEVSAQNTRSIQEMFRDIAPRYDIVNTVLSLGVHYRWKNRLIRWSGAGIGDSVLDCASGTGDLAFGFERIVGPEGKVLGTDFCEPMLAIARLKATERRSIARFEFADVMRLPYEDGEFSVVSISFGIRNVSDPVQGLRELGRVVRPGGRVMVLEFGQPSGTFWGWIYAFYSSQVLPRIGGWISGQRKAYRYLESSSRTFPCGEKFLSLARQAGFAGELRYVPLFGGIAYLYQLQRVVN